MLAASGSRPPDTRLDQDTRGMTMRWTGGLAFVLTLLGATAALAAPDPALRLDLAPSLKSKQAYYRHEINAAVDEVARRFSQWGFPCKPADLLTEAKVYDDGTTARRQLARHFQIPVAHVPATFGGTVDGSTLFVVSQEVYRSTWGASFAGYPWAESEHYRLIVHEVAHRAHAITAQKLTGSEEGMGPTWFFEGLAMYCAGQFGNQADLTATELRDRLSRAQAGKLGSPLYPQYAQIVLTLARRTPIGELVRHAAEAEFPQRFLPPSD